MSGGYYYFWFRLMKIQFIVVGKTNGKHLKAIEDDYLDRISHFCKIEYKCLEVTNAKNTDTLLIKTKEGEAILKQIEPADFVILLDDKGKQMSSTQFAVSIEGFRNRALKTVCFVVGGAYGFSDAVYARGNQKLSLSSMTFSHQIVRSIFLEQLYRAFTIIHHLPYHHE